MFGLIRGSKFDKEGSTLDHTNHKFTHVINFLLTKLVRQDDDILFFWKLLFQDYNLFKITLF